MKVVAIVPAAGRGIRLKRSLSKALVPLAQKPIAIRTLEALSKIKEINQLIVAANRNDVIKLQSAICRYRVKKVTKVIRGGSTRSQSVKNCLKHIDQDVDIVIVHDGARPLVNKEVVLAVIRKARKFGAAIAAVPVSPTIKKADPQRLEVTETLERRLLWAVSTPQAFKKAILQKAYKRLNKKQKKASDDASLVEKLGYSVKIVRDSYRNIKITTPEDLLLARLLLRQR
ncbi:2-C-methyl-D-erythritol 4-phosphate cytidylyltransferase [Candidatus Omnitrophota bacterium]